MPATECGPMITAKAVDKIDRLVEDAVARGAQVLCGGKRPTGDGFFYPPTVLADVPPDAEMAQRKSSGRSRRSDRFETEDEVDRARQRHRIRPRRLYLHPRPRRAACGSRGGSRPA